MKDSINPPFKKESFKLRSLLLFFLVSVLSDFLFAQTPFNPPFGFFGSSNASNATPFVQINVPSDNAEVNPSNLTNFTVSGTCSLPGRTITFREGVLNLGTTVCGIGRIFSKNVDLTPSLEGIRTLSAEMTNALGAIANDTINVDKDTTAPAITINAISPVKGASSVDISFHVTEAHASTAAYTLEVSNDGGSTWGVLGTTAGSAGSLSNQNFTYTWNPTPTWDISNAQIRVSNTDSYGIAGSTNSGNFIVDSQKPTLTVGTFSINSNAASTNSRSLSLSLQGSDNLSNIMKFCFKYNTTIPPSSADGCWVSVLANPPNLTPATTLNLVNYPYVIPPATGTYSFYVWLMDEAGNISTLSNLGVGTLSQDLETILYTPPIPPTILNISATSTDSPSTPFTSGDLTIPLGTDVYIKWTASDDLTLPANPISLYYTTDDATFTLIANNISNSQGAGCTISGVLTGCYKWTLGSPLNTYYKIQARVRDVELATASISSVPINLGSQIKIIAGNTDLGLGGSASSAIFLSNVLSAPYVMDPQSFVITSTGVMYYSDYKRGILKVDPNDGLQTLFIPETGVRSGDGGPVSSATLKDATVIALDADENLLIWDDARIRKVDLATSTISVLIGGGASTDATTVAATAFGISTGITDSSGGYPLLVPMPNGDIVFRSQHNPGLVAMGNTQYLRVYRKATGMVETPFSISGLRDMGNLNQDVTYCRLLGFGVAFNPSNSTLADILFLSANISAADLNCPGNNTLNYISRLNTASGVVESSPHPSNPPNGWGYNVVIFVTSPRGDLYRMDRTYPRVDRYNPATKDWTTVLGNGTRGICADGTLAIACAMELRDMYITSTNTIYFIDRGRIRMVDPMSGQVFTLYGQSTFFGDGQNPLNARFAEVTDLKVWSNAGTKTFVLLDIVEQRLREFTLSGSIQSISGTGAYGVPNTTTAANLQPLPSATNATYQKFALNFSNGNVWYRRANTVSYLDRSSGQWVDLVGGGATSYITADGLLGNQVSYASAYAPWVLGIDQNGDVIAGSYIYNAGGSHSAYVKKYNSTNGTQSHIIGSTGLNTTTLCPVGTSVTACQTPPTSYLIPFWDQYNNQTILYSSYSPSTSVYRVTATTLENFQTLPRAPTSLIYYRDATPTVDVFFYCTTSGNVYKYNRLTLVETTITLPISGMICNGKSLFYSAADNILYTGVSYNGLGAVLEITNP